MEEVVRNENELEEIGLVQTARFYPVFSLEVTLAPLLPPTVAAANSWFSMLLMQVAATSVQIHSATRLKNGRFSVFCGYRHYFPPPLLSDLLRSLPLPHSYPVRTHLLSDLYTQLGEEKPHLSTVQRALFDQNLLQGFDRRVACYGPESEMQQHWVSLERSALRLRASQSSLSLPPRPTPALDEGTHE